MQRLNSCSDNAEGLACWIAVLLERMWRALVASRLSICQSCILLTMMAEDVLDCPKRRIGSKSIEVIIPLHSAHVLPYWKYYQKNLRQTWVNLAESQGLELKACKERQWKLGWFILEKRAKGLFKGVFLMPLRILRWQNKAQVLKYMAEELETMIIKIGGFK